jgi:hypothetical protein
MGRSVSVSVSVSVRVRVRGWWVMMYLGMHAHVYISMHAQSLRTRCEHKCPESRKGLQMHTGTREHVQARRGVGFSSFGFRG